MNAEQKKMIEAILVIVGCFGIFSYTMMLPRDVYCDWTGLKIEGRLGHEVVFTLQNHTRKHYCCVNSSLLAFEQMKVTGEINLLRSIDVRCPICGMKMAWDDSMIVWVYSENYVNPTTNTPTIVPLCENAHGEILCEGHFLNEYGGKVISNPYQWDV